MSELFEALDALDLSDYFDAEGLDYRETFGSSGKQYNVHICPVCGNDEWKVYFNMESGLGNCFGGRHPAGENFNKYKFIKANSQLSHGDLMGHISGLTRVLGGQNSAPRLASFTPSSSFDLPDAKMLNSQNGSHPYLSNRGITASSCERFELMYCDTGVYEVTFDGETKRQDFSKRIIIPIRDLNGELVNFQGRDVTGSDPNKYLFPMGLKSTGSLLYNGNNAKGFRTVIVNEGVFDVIASYQALTKAGIHSVMPVGTFGKNLTMNFKEDSDDQLSRFFQLKETGLQKVVFIWDGERTAMVSAIRAGEKLMSIGLDVYISHLPLGADPNEISGDRLLQAFYSCVPVKSAQTLKKIFLNAANQAV